MDWVRPRGPRGRSSPDAIASRDHAALGDSAAGQPSFRADDGQGRQAGARRDRRRGRHPDLSRRPARLVARHDRSRPRPARSRSSTRARRNSASSCRSSRSSRRPTSGATPQHVRRAARIADRRADERGSRRQARRCASSASTYYGKRHVTSGSKAINTVDDMKGFKLRIPEVDTFRAMAEAWGAQPTPLNYRRALSRAEPGRGRRPGESAADDPERQVLRGAEVPRADRAHHHAAPRSSSTRPPGRR